MGCQRIGHGGASAIEPANTLASFDAARAVGIDAIEFDVRDYGGQLLLAHTPLHARYGTCVRLREALRRGGAIVTAKVSDGDEKQFAAIMDHRACDLTARSSAWRNEGWRGYDPDAPVFTAEEARRERAIYHRT